MFCGDETAALVGDLGSRTFKFGFAGEDSPKGWIVSATGSATGTAAAMDVEGEGAESKPRSLVGDSALQHACEDVDVTWARKDGKVHSWDAVEDLWTHAVSYGLNSDAREHPILAATPTYEPEADRAKLAEILLEKLESPAVFMPRSAILSAFSVGRATSLVVDIGAARSCACAVHDGFVVRKTVRTSKVAGDFIDEHLLRLLETSVLPHAQQDVANDDSQAQNPSSHSSSSTIVVPKSREELSRIKPSFVRMQQLPILTDLKENVCRVWTEVPLDESKAAKYAAVEYELPDGTIVSLGAERFRSPELLMRPHLDVAYLKEKISASELEKEPTSVPEVLRDALQSSHVDLRRELVQQIMLVGGGALVPGTLERLTKELGVCLPSALKPRFLSPGKYERLFSTFTGGSILASLGSFQQLWISKAEYEEHGAAIVASRCPLDTARSPPMTTPSWNSLVVLVECSVNLGSAKVSQTASRVRDLLLLATQRDAQEAAAQATPRAAAAAADNSLYVLVKRADLEAKGGSDPKSLAATLRQRIKQDRIKGLAKRQKEQEKKQPHEDQEKQELQTFAAAMSVESELQIDDTIRVGPSDADLEAARTVLGITDQQAKPDKIYVLSDYPSSAEEAAFLIASAAGEQVLDGVLELRGPVHEPSYTAPSRTDSRADSEVDAKSFSFGRTDTLASLVSANGKGDSNDLSASAASLPLLSLQSLNHTASRVSLVDPSSDGGSELVGSESASTLSETRSVVADSLAPPFDGTGPNLSNPVVNALRKARAEAKGPGWRDLVFLELDVAPRDMTKAADLSAYRPLTLLTKFAEITQSLAAEKFRFLTYVGLCEHVKIPRGAKPIREDDPLMTSYRSLSATQPMHSVAGVLHALVGAVADEPLNIIESTSIEDAEPGETHFVNFGDRCGLQLASDREANSKAQLALEHSHWMLTPTPGARGRQHMPRRPVLDEQARQLLNTQFNTFLPLSSSREQFVRIIQQFERMLSDADPPNGVRTDWDFSDWICMREMDEIRAPQQLGVALAEEPLLLTQYMARYDVLLVALHRRTPPGRRCKITRSAFAHTNLRPTFSEWPNLDLRQRPCFYDVEAEPLRALEQESELFFPCDGSVIRLDTVLAGKGRSSCSVDRDGHRFGMRQSPGASKPSFFAAFEEGGFLEVQRGPAWPNKPDKLDTMTSVYTCADGLRLEHCSNGEIRMSSPRWEKRESCRVIRDQGTVVSFLSDGSSRVLFASGDVIIYRNGEESVKIPMHDDGKVRTRIDYESDATVVERMQRPEEGNDPKIVQVMLIRHVDGTRLVCHEDGTRILTGTDGTIRVEAPGLATVKIHAAAEATCYGHSVGGRVDISRGGHVVRSSTLAPDATVVQIEYDTRVTAHINGHLRVLKPDGTTVHISDEGKVLWRSWDTTHEASEAKNRRPDEEEKDDSIGCFRFDCETGSLRMQDNERNTFNLTNVTDVAKVTCEVVLSGSFGPVEAVINHALRPRLFVLDGMGGGHELLQTSVVARERIRAERAHRGSFFDAIAQEEKNASTLHETEFEIECLELRLANAPRQLNATDALVPRIVHVDAEVAQFELARAQAKGGEQPARMEEEEILCVEPEDKVLLDSIKRVNAVSDEERRFVLQADAAYAEWRIQMDALENRFNVDDLRPDAAKAEERKIQAIIAKERKRLAKAAAKRRAADSSFKSSKSSLSQQHDVADPVTLLGAASLQDPTMEPAAPGDDAQDTRISEGKAMNDSRQEDESEGGASSPSRKPRPAPRDAPLAEGLKYSFSLTD
ncbi:Actin [Hondaea fermentalgiana]|uniref:Actin n=1 Tax=Hondaea fermentalgiana TaxID=2315210 RepID=A0A2R5GCT8_9STRA|nr:Actin [Hondaea fermentalgiana]|eukprot:GBG25981.1 Actin [Hondaea fermentalgiana]